MKKIILSLSVIFVSIYSAFSARLDVGQDRVAQVNNTIITIGEVENKYNELIKLGMNPDKVSKKQVLEMMIQNILLKEELKSAKNIILDNNQFNSMLDQVKNQYKQQELAKDPNFQYTDEKFKNFVETQGKIPYDQFEENLKDQVLMRQYISKKAEKDLQSINAKTYTSKSDFPVSVPDPQTGELQTYNSIEDFYNKNINQFIMPKNIELKHIFLATIVRGNTQRLPDSEIAIKRKKIDDIEKRLKNGESFDSLCELNSEDTESRDRVNPKTGKVDRGYLGVLLYTDENMKKQFGAAAFEKIFALKKGEISPVIESNVGFHIFLVVDKNDSPRIMGLDEVRHGIINELKYMEENKILSETMDKTLKELKRKANIVYFKDEYKD